MGPWTSIRVMPGDTVRMTVYAKYDQQTKTREAVTGMAGIIAATVTGGAGDIDGLQQVTREIGETLKGGQAALLAKNNNIPKAYLNYIFFDKEMKGKETNFKQVTEAAHSSFEELDMEFIAKEEGYLMAYTSNQTNEDLNVFTDDFTIMHTHGPIVRVDDYYPFGLTFNSSLRENSLSNKYLYNGKERQELTGWDDYGARMYQPELGRWNHVDSKAELYFGTSPYVYALNQPTQAIDPDGKIVIFINGNHFGDGGKSDYWRQFERIRIMPGYSIKVQVGKGFDQLVMDRFNDYNYLYRDGAIGGFAPVNLSANSLSTRWNEGNKAGKRDAEMIINSLARDKNGNIIESIKVVAHSMGAAYAKGYISALKKYIRENKIAGVAVSEFDFAPYQSGSHTAIDGVPTAQFSHDKDIIAGNDPIEGADQVDTSDDKNQGHSIHDFMNQISKLPVGTYEVVNGKIVPVEEKKKENEN